MNEKRLLKLADLLENIPEGRPKFNLGFWYKCGTVACAIGHAALDPWFKKRGLMLCDDYIPGGYKLPVFQDREDNEAVMCFFDISDSAVDYLFYENSYPRGRRGPKTVAKRIRSFVHNPSLVYQRKDYSE